MRGAAAGGLPAARGGRARRGSDNFGAGTAAVVPDRHGSGTNGLLLAPPDAIEPAFGPGSRERHLARAGEAGVAGRIAEIPSLGLDLDTPDDLAALRRAVGADTGRAPATARALAEL